MLTTYHRGKKLCQVIQKVIKIPTRALNLKEYQSKDLLKRHGLTIQEFCLVNKRIGYKDFERFEVDEYVVKAQVLAGGRGKGHFDTGFKGGVKVTPSKTLAKEYVEKMLGHRLITKQTPKQGVIVNDVMVAKSVTITKETYVSIVLDRLCNGPVLMISPKGGVDIESVAKKTPSLLRKLPIDIYEGVTDNMAGYVSDFLRFRPDLRPKVVHELKRLWELFITVDAVQIEINPLAATSSNNVVCVDAKLNFDDNARFRQEDIFSGQDLSETDPNEIEAVKYNLNYIKMNGNIGCLVNGAGLAMATMDIIKLFGGEPANFLDVGGSVSEEQVKKAFEILTSDQKVKVILVNVFGGIVNCELIAQGICDIAKNLTIPAVVRLEGNNSDGGKKLLADANLEIETAEDFAEAAQKAVAHIKNIS